MACFLVPAAEAIVTTVAAKAMPAKTADCGSCAGETRIPFRKKLKWLSNLLWGGSALLAFEHLWHGEVTPWFPFLTAAGDPAEASVMLHEMATVGVSMAVLLTAVWGIMVLVTNAMETRAPSLQTAGK